MRETGLPAVAAELGPARRAIPDLLRHFGGL